MRWEVCGWRGPNIEDGAAIHNATTMEDLFLQHQRQEGPWERCGGGGSCASAGWWSPIQTTTSWRGWTLIISIFSSQWGGVLARLDMVKETNCCEDHRRPSLRKNVMRVAWGSNMGWSFGQKRRPWAQYGAEETRKGRTEAFVLISESTATFPFRTRIVCGLCFYVQCLMRARWSRKYSRRSNKRKSEHYPLIAVKRKRYWSKQYLEFGFSSQWLRKMGKFQKKTDDSSTKQERITILFVLFFAHNVE